MGKGSKPKNPKDAAPESDGYHFSSQEMSEKEAREALARLAAGAPTSTDSDSRGETGADVGSIAWERIAFGAIIILLPLTIWLQQFTRYFAGQTLSDAPQSVKQSETIHDPGVAELTVYSKLIVKMTQSERSAETGGLPKHRPTKVRDAKIIQPEQDSKSKDPDSRNTNTPPPPSDPPSDPDEDLGLPTVHELEQTAWTRVQRLRVAIVAGELEGPDAALARITKLQADATPNGSLAADLAWLQKIYEEGPDTVPADVRRSLIERHGWFARLALAFGLHDSDPVRADVVSGGDELILTIGSVELAHGLIALIGFVVGILAFIKFTGSGYACAFQAPVAGGSVYLETFAVFLLAFTTLNLANLFMFGLGVEGTMGAFIVGEILMWSLVLTIFYPMLRGVKRREWALDMGLHKGEGVIKEVGAGIIGWLATHLLLFVSGLIIWYFQTLFGGGEEETSSGFGMFEAPEGSTWAMFILGTLGAILWAPIVEEATMRGALYRHLSGRMRFIFAVLLTSMIFGIIHPYSSSGLFSVAFSGISFALLREWRGSLIAPMVAHGLHNFSVGLTQIVLLSMLAD